MKTHILIAALLIMSMLFFGCTQDQTTIPTDNTADTNVVAETQIVDQEISTNLINENGVVDTGSAI